MFFSSDLYTYLQVMTVVEMIQNPPAFHCFPVCTVDVHGLEAVNMTARVTLVRDVVQDVQKTAGGRRTIESWRLHARR
ncbi:hypothetical protein D3C87_1604930 [compost metagenome]